jgi:hypothetical protein
VKPLLLLDVDGVLNPYATRSERVPEGYTTHQLAGDPVRLNPSHGPMLLEFAEKHEMALAWATIWEHEANASIAPILGLPELPVVDLGWQRTVSGLFQTDHWKFDGVLEFAGDRPLAWLDDDFFMFGSSMEWFLGQRGADRPTLLRDIDPVVGLLPEDLDAIAEWRGRLDA